VKKQTNNSIKKIIVLLFTLVVILVCGYFIIYAVIKLVANQTDTIIVKEGTISQDETVTGYIIRDESIVQGENYKNGMEQIIDEGQKVAKNEPIFRYYSQNEENVKAKISELNEKIQVAMKENVQEGALTDTKLLDSQIADKLKDIHKLNSMQAVQESKRTISSYVTKKAEIVGESSPKGSYLKDLINQRRDLEKKLSENSEYIKSTRSGILSYKVDGLEDILGTDDLTKYNKEFYYSRLTDYCKKHGGYVLENKWTKAKMALLNGFDLVLELPCIYSISSAENFATRSNKNT